MLLFPMGTLAELYIRHSLYVLRYVIILMYIQTEIERRDIGRYFQHLNGHW